MTIFLHIPVIKYLRIGAVPKYVKKKGRKMDIKNDFFLAEYEAEKRCVRLCLCGEIDHHVAFRVRRAIDEMLCTLRPEMLVIDLSDVDFMDSSGLGLIMGRYTVMQKLGGRTVVADPCERVLKMLTLAGLDKVIKIEKTKKTKGKNHEQSKT